MKVRRFIEYLEKEEEIEHEFVFPDENEPKLVPELRRLYELDEARVLRSASRNLSASSEVDTYAEFDFYEDDATASGDGGSLSND